MAANQNTTNINGKKHILPTEKLMICEIVFCGLATRSVNVVIEISIAENSVRYRPVIDRNDVKEEHLESWTFEINPGQWDII
jgi:hypothetical protein